MLAKSLTVDHSTQGCIKVRFYSEGMKGVGACFKRYTIYILYFPLSGLLLNCKKKTVKNEVIVQYTEKLSLK